MPPGAAGRRGASPYRVPCSRDSVLTDARGYSKGRACSPLGSEDEEGEAGTSASNPIGLPLSQLKRLKTKFVDERGKMKKLSLNEFVWALESNQRPCETSAQREQLRSELSTLFKKIDASCTETVDWEEFTEYMLLHMPGLNVGGDSGGCELSHGSQLMDSVLSVASWGAGHSDMISSVAVIHDIGPSGGGPAAGPGGAGGRRYVTAGRDGFLKVWLPNLVVHKEVDVGQHKGRWLTACCWMSKSRRLAVACSNFRIFFYEASFAEAPASYIDYKEATPLCLGYRESSESDGKEKEMLLVGDDRGFVTVYFMDDDWTTHEGKQEGDALLTSESKELSFEKPCIRTQYHTGWVTKVGFVSELQYMVTCGLDGEINLCDVNLNQRKKEKPAIRLHKKYGVHCWCWCGSYKFFASGGLDRQIIIWNPYTLRAINHLQGHNAPILDLQVNEAQHQLISMSMDKVIKVWDIQHYRCISTFTDKTEYKPEDRLTCMAFDEEMPGLVMCSNTLNVLPMSMKVETNRTHVAPIVGALFNDVFCQVVSGDSMGTICVWDVRTGSLEFEYRRAHGEHKLTCMSLDVSKRRLYTGGEDGEVRLWNFSSGQHLKTYTMKSPCEINGVLWAQTALTSPEGPNTFVVALALDRKIYVWPGTSKSSSAVAVEPKYILEDTQGKGHTDDISCIVGIRTVGGLLMTGGDDGTLVTWKIQETSTASASAVTARLSDRDGDGGRNAGGQRGGGGGGAAGTGGTGAAPPAGRRKQLWQGPGAAERTKMFSSITGNMEEVSAVTMAAFGGQAHGKPAARGSFLPPILTSDKDAAAFLAFAAGHQGTGTAGSAGGSASGGPAATPDAAREPRGSDTWPEELGFAGEHSRLATVAVESLLYLEQKDWLLSTHADRKARVWSHRRGSFLQYLDLEGEAWTSSAGADELPIRASSSTRPVQMGSERGERAPVTAVYSDRENRWLFTGDQEGCVRVWDLSTFYPPTSRRLPRLHEMQPHRQPVTHLQHFELDSQGYIITASQDWTVALSTLEGQRIGTFNGKGDVWRLHDRSSWSTLLPALDEPSAAHEDKGWLSSRRGGKGAGRHCPPARSGERDARPTLGAASSLSARAPRGSQVRTGAVVANKAHCGRSCFKMLSAVDRTNCKPDLTVAAQEEQFLKRAAKWENLM